MIDKEKIPIAEFGHKIERKLDEYAALVEAKKTSDEREAVYQDILRMVKNGLEKELRHKGDRDFSNAVLMILNDSRLPDFLRKIFLEDLIRSTVKSTEASTQKKIIKGIRSGTRHLVQ